MRPTLYPETMLARFPKGTSARMDAVLRPKERRADLVRTAVERELNHREYREARLLQKPVLTKAQITGLCNIRDHGPDGWCRQGSRAGGALSRMFDQMAAAGYCTEAPHTITPKGRAALTIIKAEKLR